MLEIKGRSACGVGVWMVSLSHGGADDDQKLEQKIGSVAKA